MTELNSRLHERTAHPDEPIPGLAFVWQDRALGDPFPPATRRIASHLRATYEQAGEGGAAVTLFFGPGEHHVEMTGSLFNVTQLAAPEEGRLTLAGAGMLQTTLNLTTHGHDVIEGTSGTKRLTVRDLTFARAPAQTTTQGSLMAVDETGVTIKIQSGFPQIDELLVDRAPRIRAEQGLFLRRYHRTAGDGLHIVTNASCTKANGDTSACPWPETVNYQLHFACGGDGSICPKITSPSPSVWRLAVTNWDYATGEMQRYRNDMSNPAAVV